MAEQILIRSEYIYCITKIYLNDDYVNNEFCKIKRKCKEIIHHKEYYGLK